MAPGTVMFLLMLVIFTQQSHQELCTEDNVINPTMVSVVNVNVDSIPQTFGLISPCDTTTTCSLNAEAAFTDSTAPSNDTYLEWDTTAHTTGSINFNFEAMPAKNIRVKLWYVASRKGESQICGLPSINFSPLSFPSIEHNGTSSEGVYIFNVTRSGRVDDFTGLRMTFDFTQSNNFKHFCLTKVKFFACELPLTSTAIATTPNNDNTSLVIIVSASVLGFLLLLVMLMLLGLICVVLFKRKPSQRYNVSGSHRRNTYETSRFSAPKGAYDKKYLEESILPQPPSDPEYATIQEYRQMTEMSSQRPTVTNPFYASNVSIAGRSNISEPPEYTQVVEARSPLEENPPLRNARNLEQSCTAHSLQDMRGMVINEAQYHNTTGEKLGVNRRAQTLTRSFNSHSTHNIPLQVLKRNNTMKPVPPPRSPAIQRRASQRSIPGEPYLAGQSQINSHQSPLTQYIRAARDSAVRAVGHAEDGDNEDDDVDPNNYITVP